MLAIHLIVAAALGCCPPNEAKDGVTKDQTAAQAPQVVADSAPAEKPLRMRVARVRPMSGAATVRLVSADDGEDAGGGVTVLEDEGDDAFIASAKSAGSIQPGGPWLGLQFGPPAKSLRVQLGLTEGQGQVVLNVIEGSPADTAGLQQYDVITAIDGRPVPSELDKFIDLIKTFAPGETRSVTYVRAAKSAQTSFVIGARPENVESPKYKYEVEPEVLAQNQVSNQFRILEKDKDGNWVMKAFPGGSLPNDVWTKVFPDEEMFDLSQPGGSKDNIVVEKRVDGNSIKVERRNGGDITVTRTTEQGGNSNTTVKTYPTEDELKAGDAEAFKMFSGSAGELRRLRVNPLWMQRGMGPLQNMPQWTQKDFKAQQEAMRKAQEEAAKAMEEADKAMRSGAFGMGRSMNAPKPKTTFEVAADGSIKVTVRQGDQEMIENYASADALKNARPELYKKYERLQSTRLGGSNRK